MLAAMHGSKPGRRWTQLYTTLSTSAISLLLLGVDSPPLPLPTLPPVPSAPCREVTQSALDVDWLEVRKLHIVRRDLAVQIVVGKFIGDLSFPEGHPGRGALYVRLDDEPAIYADFVQWSARPFNFIFHELKPGRNRLALGLLSREGSHSYEVRCFSV